MSATVKGTGVLSQRIRAAVYADASLNVIDGSSVWVQSTVQALASAGCEVTLLLKAPRIREHLLAPLLDAANVSIVDPFERELVPGLAASPLSPAQASQALTVLDETQRFDLVILRGMRVVRAVVETSRFDGRIWTYLTDVPQRLIDLEPAIAAELSRVATASRFMLCQTEEFRCFLESVIPETAGKSMLFPPVVPDSAFSPDPTPTASPEAADVRLVYTGKFAPRWNTLQMCDLPATLGRRGLTATLQMVGDKIHHDPTDPAYSTQMQRALELTPGVVWEGAVSRLDAIQLTTAAHFGISWRDPSLDTSLELSTKVLEFGAAGVPVVLNRTPMHEQLLGRDYALFADSADGVADAIDAAVRDADSYAESAKRCRAAAIGFSMQASIGRLTQYLQRAFPPPVSWSRSEGGMRVVVAGHDLKFFTTVLEYLQSLTNVEVRIDKWKSLAAHDARRSVELLEWADVVICEWAGRNAVWYSHNKRPGQRLVVHLHRVELTTDHPRLVDIEAVDQVVCVSPHYAAATVAATGWPSEKVVSIPNPVDVDALDRPKLPGARFHLGLIGIVPMLKRPDLALDVLSRLRRHDERFTLFMKTKMPWGYDWVWRQPEQRHYFGALLRRIENDPLIAGSVVFDDFGPDVPAWLRKVGFILSTSDLESFHLAPADGMASGAVPVLRAWEGVAGIYDRRWVHQTPESMAGHILDLALADRWEDERVLAQDYARRNFALGLVLRRWAALLNTDTDGSVAGRPPSAALAQ
jgi:glycosyltransferase involved in cell wall biosynthesis